CGPQWRDRGLIATTAPNVGASFLPPKKQRQRDPTTDYSPPHPSNHPCYSVNLISSPEAPCVAFSFFHSFSSSSPSPPPRNNPPPSPRSKNGAPLSSPAIPPLSPPSTANLQSRNSSAQGKSPSPFRTSSPSGPPSNPKASPISP